jgi:hypothetical protein
MHRKREMLNFPNSNFSFSQKSQNRKFLKRKQIFQIFLMKKKRLVSLQLHSYKLVKNTRNEKKEKNWKKD